MFDSKYKDVKTFHLLLGPECNMHCRHCSQTPMKVCSFLTKEPTEDVKNVIGKFIQLAKHEAADSNDSSDYAPLYRLFFWGGEALLHWNMIKKLVIEYTKKFDILSDNAFRFVITSNGLLLNDEMVDFMNQYKVHFNFSYDAPHPFAVRGFVSDEICERVKRIKYQSVLASGSAYNCDPLLIEKCLRAKFPKAVSRILNNIEVMHTWNFPDDIDAYNLDEIRYIVRKLVIGAKIGDSFCQHYISNFMFLVLNPDKNFLRTSHGLPACIMCHKFFAMTLDGQVPICHNSNEIIGSFKDSMDVLKERAIDYWRKRVDKQCETCKYLDMCGGGCALALRDENGHFLSCETFRKPYFRIVEEEMLRFADPLSDEELAWYKEQEKIMEQQVEEFLLAGQRYKQKLKVKDRD